MLEFQGEVHFEPRNLILTRKRQGYISRTLVVGPAARYCQSQVIIHKDQTHKTRHKKQKNKEPAAGKLGQWYLTIGVLCSRVLLDFFCTDKALVFPTPQIYTGPIPQSHGITITIVLNPKYQVFLSMFCALALGPRKWGWGAGPQDFLLLEEKMHQGSGLPWVWLDLQSHEGVKSEIQGRSENNRWF